MTALNKLRILIKSIAVVEDESRTVLIEYGETWKHLQGAPGHSAGFEAPAFDDSLWATAAAPFGVVGSGDQIGGWFMPPCVQNRPIIATSWTRMTDMTFRKTVTVPAGTTRLYFEFGVDNEGTLYVEGTEFHHEINAGCQTRGSSAVIVDWDVPGPIVVAFRGTDEQVDTIRNETFFDLRLEAISGGTETGFTERAPRSTVAILNDAKGIGASELHNGAGELHFTLPALHRQINVIKPWQCHYSLEQYRGLGWYEISSGWITDLDATDQETIFYGLDYLGVLALMVDERFNPNQALDRVAELYPADANGGGGAKYVENTIQEIVTDQLNRAVNGTHSPLAFITVGEVTDMSETVTIYAQLRERLSFIAGLIDSHRAGTGLRTRLRVRKEVLFGSDPLSPVESYEFVVEDDPGLDRTDLTLEWGGLVQGYRVIPFGDFGTRVLAIGQRGSGFRLEYEVVSTPPPDGESENFNELQYGRLPKVNIWTEIVDLNDLRRRARQYGQKIGAVGKQVGIGLRVNALAVKDGWNICDSVPVVIQRGGVDTTLYGSGLWTIWGWQLSVANDGSSVLVLSLLPKQVTQDGIPSQNTALEVSPAAPFVVHDTDPPLDEDAGNPGNVWFNGQTGHIFTVDPLTGLWVDRTDLGDFTLIQGAPSVADKLYLHATRI